MIISHAMETHPIWDLDDQPVMEQVMKLHRESNAYWDGYNATVAYVLVGSGCLDAPDDLSDAEQEDWKRGVQDALSDS